MASASVQAANTPYSIAAVAAVLLVACAAQPSAPRTVREPPARTQTQVVVTGKPLHMARQNEPPALASKFGGPRSGLSDYALIFGAPLVRFDYLRNPVPVLAEMTPSLQASTWKVYPDRRMDTTYKLRPSATWHDGTPFTADDVIFTWGAIMNPELPAVDRQPERLIEDMEAPDPHTLVIHWKETFVDANAYELEPLPRHILEPLQRDSQAFINAPYWSVEWVGLGPYQVADWVPGSYVKGRAFINYVLGTPKIEEIYVHFVVDANQVVARMLAGGLDLTLGSVIKTGEAALLKPQLEARGEGTVVAAPNSVRIGDFQFREPQPPPARDVRIRQAVFHSLDRKLMVDTLHDGINVPADAWLAPDHPGFKAAERAMRKYLYDPNRAQQLLSDAGWTRGPDGILRSAVGEVFDFGLRTTEGAQNVKDAQVIAEFWKSVGINTDIEVTPRARQNDQEYRAKFPGIALASPSIEVDSISRWLIEEIPSDANRWRGSNRGGYARTDVDRLITDYSGAIEVPRRTQILADLLKLLAEDLPSLPLYYQMDVHGVRAGLQGVVPTKPGDGWTTFNAHQWYWDR
jgi:peptide/nickel transport system substrate-binding protein